MRAVIGFLCATLFSGCAGSGAPASAAPDAEAGARACTHQLGSRSVSPAVDPLTPPVNIPASRLIVRAELPLATLASELERNIAPRLAEGRTKIGRAGVLEYSVDRGAFALAITDGQLVVETPLTGHAEACSGRRCYAACEPRALARARVPLWLRPDYRFDRSQVELSLTRGCKVRALRGLLNIDVTPILKSAIAPQLERVRREIDRKLPDVRSDVARAWRQLSAPRALPLVGCVVIEPLGLVQGPMHEVGGMAHVRFALLARPELRPDCPATAPSVPLPPLRADPALPDEDSVMLGMEQPLASLARAFEAEPPKAGSGPRFRVAEARIQALGQRVSAQLMLADELCGTVELQAEPSFEGEEGFILLTAGRLDAGESERVRAAGLDPAMLAQQLTHLPRVEAPLSLPMLRLAPPALAALFSDPHFALSARVSSLRAAGAAARGENLVAWVEARGSLLLERK